jgi:hypothetical protein
MNEFDDMNKDEILLYIFAGVNFDELEVLRRIKR